MLRRGKYILGIAGLLLGVVLFLVLIPPQIANHQLGRIIRQLESAMGRKIEIRQTAFSIFSGLCLKGIQISNPALKKDEPPLLFVEQVQVDLTIWSVFQKRLRIKSLRVKKPRLSLIYYSLSRSNFSDLKDKLRDLLNPSAQPTQIQAAISSKWLRTKIERIQITELSIRFLHFSKLFDWPYLDQFKDLELTQGTIDILASTPVAASKEYRFQGEFEVPLLKNRVQIKGAYDTRDHFYDLLLQVARPFEIKIAELQFGAKGLAVTLSNKNRQSTSLKPKSGSLKFFSALQAIAIDSPRVRILKKQAGQGSLIFSILAKARAIVQSIRQKKKALQARIVDWQSRENQNGRPGEKVTGAIRQGFSKIEQAIEAAVRFLGKVGKHFPLDRIQIEKGEFINEQWNGDSVLPHEIKQIGLSARNNREKGEIGFTLHFSFPESLEYKNRLEGSINYHHPAVGLKGSLPGVYLKRLKGRLPDFILIEPDTLLKCTDFLFNYTTQERKLRFKGKAGSRTFSIDSKELAAKPLKRFSLQIDLAGEIDFEKETFLLKQADFNLNQLKFQVRGDIKDFFKQPRLYFFLVLPSVSGQTVLDSLPRELLPVLSGIRASGTVSGWFEFFVDTRDMSTLKYDGDLKLDTVLIESMGRVVNFNALKQPFIHRVKERDNRFTEFKTGPGSKGFVKLKEISPYLVLAVTTTEDGGFFNHQGFISESIRESIVRNLKEGRFALGASTITMQLAKNLYLPKAKTISRKLQEVLITWQMEKKLKKEDLLSLYFNIIEWGPKIYGIATAAKHYFDKTPKDLTLLECIYLSSIIPHPIWADRMYKDGYISAERKKQLARYLEIMAHRGKISEKERLEANPENFQFIKSRPAKK